MQVLLISLVAVLLIPHPGGEPTSLVMAAAVTWGATLGWIALMGVWANVLLRRLDGAGGLATVRKADRSLRVFQWGAVGIVGGGALCFGWVESVRLMVGDILVVDELVAALPAALILLAAWWVFYPFERRVREARLIRDLDEGVPVSALPTRGSWVVQQVRTQVLILIVPLVAVAIAADGGRRLAELAFGPERELMVTLGGLACAVPVVLFVPAMVVRMLATEPLAEGEIRSMLETACTSMDVRIRDILLWRTGGMINGAVTGLLARWRWVLLSDGLLERLERDEVLAVMAHELAHVRRRHMVWLAFNVLAATTLITVLATPLIDRLGDAIIERGGSFEVTMQRLEWVNAAGMGVVLLGVLGCFGWVSRRFEWQADAFAAVHLSGKGATVVTASGLGSMQHALEAVALFNGVQTSRQSWRHGSIDTRVARLGRLEGVRVDRLPIDAIVGWVNLASLVVVVLAVAYLLFAMQTETMS